MEQNFAAVDATLAHLYEVTVPDQSTSTSQLLAVVPSEAPDFVKEVTAMMMSGHGDELPVSKMSQDGTYPSGTTKWEKEIFRISFRFGNLTPAFNVAIVRMYVLTV